MTAFIIIIILVVGFAFFYSRQRTKTRVPASFPVTWKNILDERVLFYHDLQPAEKNRFERDIIRFFNNVIITGVNTEADITDRLLVASSAVIPVFGFPEWDYTFLDEVLLYPDMFDSEYTINSKEEAITGMVGNGTMEGKMILSKPSLHRGFDNTTDKQNVGIHEFIHLLDKEDGSIDGVPSFLNNKTYAVPWLKLIQKKTEEIIKGDSDINEYGATHQREFLPVAAEYFFERPQQLKKKHPELYDLLHKAFRQDTASTLKITKRTNTELERNDPCPCGSGKKFKKCCIDK